MDVRFGLLLLFFVLFEADAFRITKHIRRDTLVNSPPLKLDLRIWLLVVPPNRVFQNPYLSLLTLSRSVHAFLQHRQCSSSLDLGDPK